MVNRIGSFGSLVLLSLVAIALSPSAANAQRYNPLHQWYNGETGDSRITSDPAWIGQAGATRDGYRWVGIAGSVISPNIPAQTIQPGMLALHTWFNPVTRDYWTSSQEAWRPTAPASGRRRGYRHVRFEGYVYRTALAGTLPLYGSWNARQRDYHVTTPALHNTVYVSPRERARSLTDGYSAPGRLGYVLAPRKSQIDPDTLASLGVANTQWRNRNGVVAGNFPIVLMMTEYEELPLRRSVAEMRDYMYADDQLSIASFYKEMSRGKLNIREGESHEPVQWRDNPDTELDESNFNCIVWSNQEDQIEQLTRLCPGYRQYSSPRDNPSNSYEQRIIPNYVRMIDSRVDFSRYDKNRNGIIDRGEMALMVIVPQPDPDIVDTDQFPVRGAGGGITRGSGLYGGCIPVDGVRFCADIFEVGEDASVTLIGHELFHALNTSVSFNDIYGSGSGGASLMATSAGSGERLKVFHLDAWHKMRLGWAKPHVKVIGKGIPPSSALLSSPDRLSAQDWYTPYVFYDPARGPHEMFLAEARLRKGYDSGTLDKGIAVWYAKVESGGRGNGPNYNLNPFNIVTEMSGRNAGRTWTSTGGESLWTIGFQVPGNNRAERRGYSRSYLKKEYGERLLHWYPENPRSGYAVTGGPSSGLSLRAGEELGRSIELEFIPDSDIPFRPRIDRMLTTATTNQFTLTGDFGVRDDGQKLKVIFERGGERDLLIISWTAERITFVRPPDLPEGRHFLQVMGNPEGTVRGNRFPLFISGGEGLL